MQPSLMPPNIWQRLAKLPSLAWLLGCSLAIILIFGVCFTSRYSLAVYGHLPSQSFANLSGYSWQGAALYILAFAASFGAYWVGFRLGVRSRHPTRMMWLAVIASALILYAVLLPMYPLDATDVYDNIIRGRMGAVYGLNPFLDAPNRIPQDPFYRFIGWRHVPSAYGGMWELIATFVARLAGDDYLTNVIAFKVLASLGSGLTMLGIYLLLRKVAPTRALEGVYLFALNPLVAYHVAGRGHNDALMTGFAVLGFAFLARKWHIAATIALLFGALIKFIPLILIPIVAIRAWRFQAWLSRARYILGSAILGGALIFVCYAPYWHGFDTLRTERRAEMFTGSIPTVLRPLIAPIFDGTPINARVNETPNTNTFLANSTLLAFAVFYGWILWREWHSTTGDSAYQSATLMLMGYLLIATLWFMAWYVIWPLAFAVTLADRPLRRIVLIFSYLVAWQSLLYRYLTLRDDGWATIPWRDGIPVASYMLMIWVIIALYAFQVRSQRLKPT